jgi:hypothetical protein
MIWLLLPVANQNNWSRWVVISSVSPIGSPSFSFMGGVRKKAKLGCGKYFSRVTYWALLEIL